MMETPRKNSTPKMIFDCGIKTRVNTVTRTPQIMTVRPLLVTADHGFSSGFRLMQNPLMKINSQQMLCCQRYPSVFTNQGQLNP